MKIILIAFSFFFFFQKDIPQIFTSYDNGLMAVIIFAPDNQSKAYNRSITLLTKDPLGIDKRNIKIFEIFQSGGIGPSGESISEEEVTSIRKYYDIYPTNFKVILSAGKSAEIFRSDKPITLEEIFERFDQID